MANKKKEITRLIYFILGGMFFLSFLIVNLLKKDISYDSAFIFASLLSGSFMYFINWNRIPKKKPQRNVFAIQDDAFGDAFYGVLTGIFGIIILSAMPVFSFAIPSLPSASAFPEFFSTAGQYLTVVGIAPFTEEIFFRGVIFSFLFIVLGLGLISSTILSSLAFSFFHINAYAGSLSLLAISSVSNAFIGAFFVGVVFCLVNYWRGSITTSIGAHSIINIAILIPQAVAL